MKIIKRLLREPLVHFLAIGGLIFAVFAAISDPGPMPPDKIVVAPARIAQLAKGFQAVWRRRPNDAELDAMIDEFVREEIYYREALALGLDRNDTIVRRRLKQKMEFLSNSGAEILKPVSGELEIFFRANEKSFRQEMRVAFEQIFLGRNPSPQRIKRILAALERGSVLEISKLGESTFLPAKLRLSPSEAVDGVFGKGFFKRLVSFSPGEWAGPIASAYGIHLVRINITLTARTPPLAEVRDAVIRDWRAEKAREIGVLQYARLLERYVVEIQRADVTVVDPR